MLKLLTLDGNEMNVREREREKERERERERAAKDLRRFKYAISKISVWEETPIEKMLIWCIEPASHIISSAIKNFSEDGQ